MGWFFMREVLLFTGEESTRLPLEEGLSLHGISLRTRGFDKAPKHRMISRADVTCVCFEDAVEAGKLVAAVRRWTENARLCAVVPKGSFEAAAAALRMGVLDYIELPGDDSEIAARLRLISQRTVGMCPFGATRCPYDGERDGALYRLSEREREVAELMVAGHASKVIAHILGISMKTVEIHRARVFQKTEAGSMPDLARLFWAQAGQSARNRNAAPRLNGYRQSRSANSVNTAS